MGHREEYPATCHDIDQIDLGFAVSLETLCQVLKTLNNDKRRWWIATAPCEAVESGYLRIGYEDRENSDLLTRIYFQLPVLSKSLRQSGADRIVILLDASCCIPDQAGLYVAEKGQIEHDVLEDFTSFYYPLKRALIHQMQANG